jgi:hypothetical protein
MLRHPYLDRLEPLIAGVAGPIRYRGKRFTLPSLAALGMPPPSTTAFLTVAPGL